MRSEALKYRNPDIEVPYHSIDDANTNMGSWFSDAIGINFDAAAAAQNLANTIANTIRNVGISIQNINWNLVSQNLQTLSHVVANVMLQTTPLYYVYQGLKTNPLTDHAFSELDKLTGNLLTDVTNLQTLPLRVVRGDPITKTECINDALLAIKVVIVVMSGGTATSVVSQSSSQLSRGTLGTSAVGKDILIVGGAAALTSLQGGDVANAIVKSGESVGLSAAQTQVVKSSPLGQTEIGKIAIGAGFAAGGGEITGSGAGAGLTSFARSTAISEGARVGPGGSQAAGLVYDSAGNLVAPSSSGGTSDSGGGIDWGAITQIPGKIVDALSNINLSSLNLDLSQITLPSISAPSISAPEVNVGQIPNISVPGKTGTHHVVSRTKKIVNGVTSYVYTLDDGSQYEIQESTGSFWPYALLAGLGIFFIVERES